MRKLKLAMYVSIDGVVENPGWTGPFWNDELARLQQDYLFASDALVLGRVTYEGFAAAWPTMTETGAFGEKMNSMPKFVASHSLDSAEWNATILPKGDVVAEVGRLKDQSGSDLLIYGSGTLVEELSRAGVIDEYRLMVHPVIVGSGRRLLSQQQPLLNLRVANSVVTGTGVAVLTYNRPADA